MIRTISNISEISVVDLYPEENLHSFNKISFNDKEFGFGGVGSVFEVETIDGNYSNSFLLKLIKEENLAEHAFETILLLHQKIKKHQLKTGELILNKRQGVYGIPFLIFKGHDDILDEPVCGFLMVNLIKQGFEDYGSDEDNSFELKNLDFQNRYYLAYQFAKTVSLFNDFQFLHSDIKSESIFINPITLQFALIDFDSGFHVDAQEKPTVIAALTYWISDFFKDKLGANLSTGVLTTANRIAEENWVITNGLFELLFGLFPYFFLKDADIETRKKYQKQFNWPEIDPDSELINPSAIAAHENLIEIFQNLVNNGFNELVESFFKVFNEGYNDGRHRLSASEWFKVLKSGASQLELKPEITSFEVSTKEIRRKGEEVIVSWSGKRFETVYINGILQALNKNSCSIKMEDAGEITIELKNDFGVAINSISIEAIKVPPQIISFSPTKFNRDTLDPILLQWETTNTTHVTISSISDDLDSSGEHEVEPIKRTVYELIGHGFFGEQTKSKIEISIIEPEINLFKSIINLDEGIDNVDLTWSTKNAEEVSISPLIGVVNNYGLRHIAIQSPTLFTLKAKGLFSEAVRQLEAHPFPLPTISHLFVESPPIKINADIQIHQKMIDNSFQKINNISFSNPINFSGISVDFHELSPDIIKPEKIHESAKIVSFSKLFEQIKSEIQNKLNHEKPQ